MSAGLNKKVLCFVDEYGTAGQDRFYLGAVLVMARDAGRVDKCFSDLLRPTANEVHAVALKDRYIQGLMQRFRAEASSSRVTMINNRITTRGGEPPVLYANAIIETVKIGLRRFAHDVLSKSTISNTDVITDVNQHNDHPSFDAAMDFAREHDGRFRGVNRVVRLDSAASWINAETMQGIQVAGNRNLKAPGDHDARQTRGRVSRLQWTDPCGFRITPAGV